MAKKKDYIPKGDKDFFAWQDNLVGLMTAANLAAWGIDPLVFAVIAGLQSVYQPLFNAILNKATRTKVDIDAHRASRKDYEKALRKYVRENLANNSKVTDKDRQKLQIPVLDTTKTPRKKITDTVFAKAVSLPGAQMEFICRTTNDSSRASMHADADEVEIRYHIGSAPANVKACTGSFTSRKAKFILTLDGEAAGQKIYWYVRWKNSSDDTKSGPYGGQQSGTVSE